MPTPSPPAFSIYSQSIRLIDQFVVLSLQIYPAVAVDILLDHSMTSDCRKKCAPSSNKTSCCAASANSSVPNIKQVENPSSAAPKRYLPPHLRARIASAQPQPQQQQQQQQQQRGCSQSSVCSSTSALSPEDAEWRRNRERFEFIKWCGQAFDNVNVIPPVSGLSHQVEFEGSSASCLSACPSAFLPIFLSDCLSA